MTPERLKKVEEIYHAVLVIPPPEQRNFLKNSCGEDVELRREVESLLSFEKTFASIIDTPPENLLKKVFFSEEKSSLIGSQINQYKILSLLGKGGMGTVYLALDKKLERKVAIKFLSDDFIRDGNNLHRFFREAKSASALNHPNIITVYEIAEFAGNPFIATEFIDGITLKEHSAKRRLLLGEMLDIAIQMASALSTAHKAGIIHRDIKPDNVMIREDGIVKILDFGLAKISQDLREIDTEANTREKISTIHGVILGTPQYMSPEQTRGREIDTRTDIWSFGVLLYQILTHQLPFEGETTSDLIASILKSEPPPLSRFVGNIPPELEQLILKTLRKNPDQRYQTIDEILAEIKSLRSNLKAETKTEPLHFRVSDHIENQKITDAKYTQITAGNSEVFAGNDNSILSQTIHKAREFPVVSSLILVSLVSIFVLVGLGFSKLFSPTNQSDSFQKMKLAKLTFDGTATGVTAVAPDGKNIAYATQIDGIETLWLKQIASGATLQLVPPAEVVYFGATFSNDSNYVYYTVHEKGSENVFEISNLGGNPRKIVNNVSSRVSFSPDGKMMAFGRSRNSVVIADAKGGGEKLLAKAGEGEIWRNPVWNSDGKSIVFTANKNSKEYLSEVAVDSGEVKRFDANDWTNIVGITWLSDGSGLILSGRNAGKKFLQLWFLSYPDDNLRHLTNDFNTYTSPDLTTDGKTLVAVKNEKLYNIWLSADGTQNSLKKLTVEEGKDDGLSGLAQTPEGKIVYTVNINNTIDIWSVNADGSGNRQLTFDQGKNVQPTVSPDGKYIVFASTRSGKQNLWRMNTDGSEQTILFENVTSVSSPVFTPDGKWIIYKQFESSEISTIWKINVEDKQTVQLTQIGSSRPIVSPDGKFFVCSYGAPAKLAVISVNGGQPVKIFDFPLVLKSENFRWSNDGKSLIYIDKRDRISNLWAQPISGEAPKQLTFFDAGQIYQFEVAPNGKGFAFSRGNESSDVVMFSDFR